jgi:hypothetical protein
MMPVKMDLLTHGDCNIDNQWSFEWETPMSQRIQHELTQAYHK